MICCVGFYFCTSRAQLLPNQPTKHPNIEWEQELEDYVARHPTVRVHDMPRDTYVLRNRGSMLAPWSDLDAMRLFPGRRESTSPCTLPIRCAVPLHTTIAVDTPFETAKIQLECIGMTFPVLAKNIFADGRPGSHDLAVVHTEQGLKDLVQGTAPGGLSLPLLFEQYVNHGTCLFKVYVLGEEAVMVTRPSLHLEEKYNNNNNNNNTSTVPQSTVVSLETSALTPGGSSPPVPYDIPVPHVETPDVEIVSRVSAYPRARSWGKGDLAPLGHGVPRPPEWLWKGIADRIRKRLGLSLFNFDLIVPLHPPARQSALVGGGVWRGGEGQGEVVEEGLVYLIDINYFPGIEKLPEYEELLIRFLEQLRHT